MRAWRLVWMVAIPVCLSPAADGGTPSEGCRVATRARAEFRAGCDRLAKACRAGERDACRKDVETCGLVEDVRRTDAVLAACGMPPPPRASRPDPGEAVVPGTEEPSVAPASRPATVQPTKTPAAPAWNGVDVYGRTRCPMTTTVVAELKAAGIPYRLHSTGKDPEAKALVSRNHRFLPNPSAPLLVVSGRPTYYDYGNVVTACRKPGQKRGESLPQAPSTQSPSSRCVFR